MKESNPIQDGDEHYSAPY